jgi:glycosyltransferase involved in cell wall biosynthesis
MRIGIDYTAAVHQRAGIGRYARNLVRALAELDRADKVTLFVAGGWGDGDGLGPWPPNFRLRSVPLSDRWLHILWQRLRLPVPVQTVTGPLDLFHSPDFVLPPVGRTPAILTVHDLSFMRVPQFFVPGFRSYLEGAVARGVRRARHILADSESTRRDLIELLGVESERVTVIYPGVESRFKPVCDAAVLEKVGQRYRLPERFVLALGTLQPRKNFDGLIRAFGRLLAAKAKDSASRDLHLVVVGSKGWMYQDLYTLVDDLGLAGKVHFPGFVADPDLPALYSLAMLVCLPSWYEGFGLPMLEAMACGTPVLAADNSSLPEVVGEAGVLVDIADNSGLTEALYGLLVDETLRGQCTALGLEQASRFTWEKAAGQLLELYRSTAMEMEQEGCQGC